MLNIEVNPSAEAYFAKHSVARDRGLTAEILVMDVSGIAGAGKSHLLKQVAGAAFSMGKSIAISFLRRKPA